MVLRPRNNSGSHIDRRWHERRRDAQRFARSTDEFGPIEIEEADLDEFDGKTGPTVLIDGRGNPDTYTVDPEFGPIKEYHISEDPRFD